VLAMSNPGHRSEITHGDFDEGDCRLIHSLSLDRIHSR
jgi:hypothetical protein